MTTGLMAFGVFIFGASFFISLLGSIAFLVERDWKEFKKWIIISIISGCFTTILVIKISNHNSSMVEEIRSLYEIEYIIHDPNHEIRKTIQSEVPLEVEVYNETIGFFGGRVKSGYRLVERDRVYKEVVDSKYPIEIIKQIKVR